MDEIEIQAFEGDTKASKGITAAHVADIASGYDSEKNPAPLVWGHPASDSPALGMISAARAEGAKLFLKIKGIAQEVIDGAKEGRILNRSVAIWDPGHPSNPNPGKYSLRHLGLLGGQAPAIPNMPRLRFSADESALEMEDGPADAIVFTSEVPKPTGVREVREAAPPTKELEMTAEEIAAKEAEFATKEREIAERERKAKERDDQFAASEKTRREGENAAAIDKAIADGKVLPAEKADLAAIFNALPVQAMTFSAALGGAELEPRQGLAKFLEALPKRTAVGAGPHSPDGEYAATGNKEKSEAALKASNEGQAEAWKPKAATA